MAKKNIKKRSRKTKAVPRQAMYLRLPPKVVRSLDEMAAEVGMSRNAVITLMLSQSAAMHEAQKREPRLFSDADALIEGALRRALGKGPSSD